MDRHFDYHRIVFFSWQTPFNIDWNERPAREIRSYLAEGALGSGGWRFDG